MIHVICVYMALVAIGLFNRRHAAWEQGLLSFPEDYPDSLAGRMHEDHLTRQATNSYSRKSRGHIYNPNNLSLSLSLSLCVCVCVYVAIVCFSLVYINQ